MIDDPKKPATPPPAPAEDVLIDPADTAEAIELREDEIAEVRADEVIAAIEAAEGIEAAAEPSEAETAQAAVESSAADAIALEMVMATTADSPDQIAVDEAETAVAAALETLAAVRAETQALMQEMEETARAIDQAEALADAAAEAAIPDAEEAPAQPATQTDEQIREAAQAVAELPVDDLPTPAETEEQLKSLDQAMQKEEERQAEELEGEAVRAARAAAQELEQMIAEDIAVEKAQADEAARLAAEAEEEAEPVDENLLAALPKVDDEGNLDLQELESCIEALVFLSERPISRRRLREYLGEEIRAELFDDAIAALYHKYQSPSHGIELIEVAGGLQIRTKPGRQALAKKLLKTQTERLSRGAMETLAIVAYRQPVMKEDVDKIRGVDTSHFIRRLMERKLVGISGRSELPGRPMLYVTTDRFLEVFGLRDLAALPPLRELEQMIPTSETKNPEDGDPRILEMRRLVGQMKADRTSLAYDPGEDERFLREIRERVQGIAVTTPYLQDLVEQEKLAAQGLAPETGPAQPELPVEAEAAVEAAPAGAPASSGGPEADA
ncbi:MAG TPA: SMC-Scp complex subunit ScpB [Bdellovibrionota bacterium]|nr:SMC-Scp complex subunit ScpB [Bdellovibrionota bacterium]